MKGRAKACLSMASDQLGRVVAIDAANYTANFTASTLLFVVGTAAKMGGSPATTYLAYALAVVEAAVAARQWSAARFFAQKQAQTTSAKSTDDEKFHEVLELPSQPVADIKKMQ